MTQSLTGVRAVASALVAALVCAACATTDDPNGMVGPDREPVPFSVVGFAQYDPDFDAAAMQDSGDAVALALLGRAVFGYTYRVADGRPYVAATAIDEGQLIGPRIVYRDRVVVSDGRAALMVTAHANFALSVDSSVYEAFHQAIETTVVVRVPLSGIDDGSEDEGTDDRDASDPVPILALNGMSLEAIQLAVANGSAALRDSPSGRAWIVRIAPRLASTNGDPGDQQNRYLIDSASFRPASTSPANTLEFDVTVRILPDTPSGD